MGIPLAIAAATGAVSELVGIVQEPHRDSVDYTMTAIVGQGDLLAEIATRLSVPLLASLSDVRDGTHVALSGGGSNRVLSMEMLAKRGLSAATLIHTDTTIGPWVTIGEGSTVSPGVRITGNVMVGSFCQLHTGAILSHDDVLADNVTLSPGVTLCGGVTIGRGSTVFAGATVMPGLTIGSDAVVGAGALVNRDVPDGVTVAGVPAKVLS